MDQYDSLKADGLFATKSVQELALEAHEPVLKVFPAQSPQKVVSNTICRFLKFEEISQDPEKTACGKPQLATFDGSGEPLLRSDGTDPLGKKYMLMELFVQRVAYTPPPLELNPSP